MPGYLLINMNLTDDSWGLVKNTPGVTGFVGPSQKPVPLSQPEVDRLLNRETAERPRTRAQLREIAEKKMADLNANDIDQAEKIIAGTARSMGITVTG